MSNYRRLISYIYAYEGEVKGKNIGFAKIEIRNGQCRIQANVKKVFLGGSDIGVYLLCPEAKIQLGRIFIRNGSGEFRTTVNAVNVENSGYSIEHCYGLSIYEQDNSWRRYTTIWEDAVVQAAEIQLAGVTAERVKAQSPNTSESRNFISEEIEQELQQEEQKKEDSLPWQESNSDENKIEITKTNDEPKEEESTTESAEESTEEPVKIISAGEGQTGKIWIVSKPKKDESPKQPEEEKISVKDNFPIEDLIEDPIKDKTPVKEIPVSKSPVTETPAEKSSPMEESPEKTPIKEKPVMELPIKEITAEKKSENKKPSINIKSQPPEPGDPARLKELERLEKIENLQSSIWNQLQRRYPKVLAFDYANGCEILSIKPQDIGILPRENWVYGNNSFLLHGYYNYRHLILAKLNNPEGEPRYLLGVPGHYFSNEKNMASMFGFPNFVLAKKQPEEDGRFGYWYTDLRL